MAIFNLIWIGGVGTFLVMCFLSFLEWKRLDLEDVGMSFLGGIVGAVISLLIALISAMIISGSSNRAYVVTYESPIYTTKENQFIIVENQSNKFKVYTDENNQQYVETPQGDTQIIDDGENKVVVYKEFYQSETVKWLVGERTGKDPKYEIHVPKGAILTTENKMSVN